MRWPGIFVLRAEEHLAVWLGRSYNGSSDTQFGTLSVKNVVGMRGLENMLHKMKYLNCIPLLYLPYFFWEIENSSLQETRTEHFGCRFLPLDLGRLGCRILSSLQRHVQVCARDVGFVVCL